MIWTYQAPGLNWASIAILLVIVFYGSRFARWLQGLKAAVSLAFLRHRVRRRLLILTVKPDQAYPKARSGPYPFGTVPPAV